MPDVGEALKLVRDNAASIFLGCLAIAIAAVKSCWIFSDSPMPAWIWAMLACVGLIAALVLSGRPKFNPLLIALVGACLLSIGWNNPDPHFRCYQRLGYFALSLALLSPLVTNEGLVKMRRAMWLTALVVVRLGVVGSAIIYIVYHLGYLPDNTVESLTYGKVYGVMSHSNLLTILSALAALVSIVQLCFDKSAKRSKKVFHIVMAAIALWCVILTGSRNGPLSFAGGFAVVCIYGLFRQCSAFLRGTGWVVLATCALIICNGTTLTFRGLTTKIAFNQERGGQTYSRTNPWNDRIDEFVSSPIVGIGFANQIGEANLYSRSEETAIRENLEPGSSWLSVASMTGILGVALMLFFNVTIFLKAIRLSDLCQRVGLTALLVMFWVNGIAEGWVYFAGAYIFFLYWLLTGLIWGNGQSSTDTNENKRVA